MAKAATRRKSASPVAVTPLISYQPFGVRKRGRGVAFVWPLAVVLRFVEEGIDLKRQRRRPKGYLVGYDRVDLPTLERVRRWLLKDQRSQEPIVEVPSTGAFQERYDVGRYVTVAKWFGRFIHDWRHQSVYCPRCRESYPKGKVKFVILGPCPSGWPHPPRHGRAPTGLACPKGHLLLRH
jgi:hypothetical protein